MELFTVQMSNWREVAQRKIELVDTTVKGKSLLFAPTWDMVMGHKSGQVSDAQYTHLYYEKMRGSYLNHQAQWQEFLQRTEPVAIACYCPPDCFCHRHLLRDILQRVAGSLSIPFIYYGEL